MAECFLDQAQLSLSIRWFLGAKLICEPVCPSLTHPLTHSSPHWLLHLLTLPHIYSLTYSLTLIFRSEAPLWTCLSFTNPSNHSLIHSLIYHLTPSSTHSVYSFVCFSDYTFVCLFVCLFIRLAVYSFVCLFVCLFIR